MQEALKWFEASSQKNDLSRKYTDNLFSHLHATAFDGIVSDADRDFLTERYFPSLIKLKLKFWETKNPAFSRIYLDERLRYAPHRLPLPDRAEFFRGLLDSEIKLLKTMGAPDAVVKAFKDLNKSLVKSTPAKTTKLLAVGDCLLNEVRAFLPDLNDSVATDVRCIYFSANQAKGLDLDEIKDYLANFSIDLISFSFLSYEALPGYSRNLEYASSMATEELKNSADSLMCLIKEALSDLRRDTNVTFLLHGCSGLPLSRFRKNLPLINPLNKKQKYFVEYLDSNLRSLADEFENCLFVDEKTIAESKGYRHVSREIAPQKKFGGMFHTTWFGKYLAEDVYLSLLNSHNSLSKCKLLLVDFDNTLWNGVMADGDVEHYHDRQNLLVQLKDSGIILVALSKNSPENIRWDEMTLKPNDFALLKINWNTKTQSVKEVSSTLELGMNSFVLLDDSQQERSLINNELPEILCLNSLDDTTWASLEWMKDFPNTQNTTEAKERTKMYQEQAQRKDSLSAEVDYPAMMQSLSLWYSYSFVTEKQLDRVSELVARTNQFNTTTIRYSKKELERLIADPEYTVVYGELGDKFGTLGLVSVLILRERRSSNIDKELVIESFVMSCRAMGFNFEFQLLSLVEDVAREIGANAIIGRFVATDRNGPCSRLYESAGFDRSEGDEWQLLISKEKLVPGVGWFEVRK